MAFSLEQVLLQKLEHSHKVSDNSRLHVLFSVFIVERTNQKSKEDFMGEVEVKFDLVRQNLNRQK